MAGVLRAQCANFGAAATAAIVGLGLVTVPPDRYESFVARTEVAAVHLQAAVATQMSALANSTSAAPLDAPTKVPAALSAADIAANPLGDVINAVINFFVNVAKAGISLLLAPVLVPLRLWSIGLVFGCAEGGAASCEAFKGLTAFLDSLTPNWGSTQPQGAATIDTAQVETTGVDTAPADAPTNPTNLPTDPIEAEIADTSVLPVSQAVVPTVHRTSTAAEGAGNDPLTTIVNLAIAAVLAPLWYVAFPVTLPISFAMGWIITGLQSFSDPNARSPINFLLTSLLYFVIAPLNLFVTSTPAATAAARGSAEATSLGREAKAEAAGVTEKPKVGSAATGQANEANASASRRERGATPRARATPKPAASATVTSTDATGTTPDASNTSVTTALSDFADAAPSSAGGATLDRRSTGVTSRSKGTNAPSSRKHGGETSVDAGVARAQRD